MSHRSEKRARRAYRSTNAAMLAAMSVEALCLSAPRVAHSQTTPTSGSPPENLEEVTVTGFRESLESALARKRSSIQPIESVVAEDLGKLPDQNVAEALQRLPGVSINRAGGKGTQVLIDGLRNNLITLNGEVFLTGREFYVSGEASGGGNGGTVQYQSLESIPSEEVSGIDVIKNPTAQNREGGLGGIIDIRTRAPLEQPMGLTLGGNVRGTKADGPDFASTTPQATAVGSFKFNDRFGITASFSYDDQKLDDRQFQDQNRNQWLVTNTAQVGSYVGSPSASTLSTMPGGQTYIDPQLGYFSDILQQVKTTGASFGAEWRWTDQITSTFNYFYVNQEDESTTYSDKAWFSGGSGQTNHPGAPASFPGIDPSQPYSIDGHGVVQSATFMANGAETSTLYQNNSSHANNFQFVTHFGGDGRFTGDASIAYAKATSNLQAAQADVEHGFYGAFDGPASIQPTAPGCNNGGNSCDNGNHGYAWTWNNGGSSGLPHAGYADSYGYTNVLSNAAYTLFKSNWAWANQTDETNKSVMGDLKFNYTDLILLTAGARYSERDVDQVFGRYLIDGANAGSFGKLAGVASSLPNGGNCCRGATNGSWIYYSDPGYATIPFSTPQTNPGLAKLYNNFVVGNIMVKDPVTGGMTNPSTYLNTLWNQAGVANNTERFFEDTVSSFKVTEKTTSAFLMADAGTSSDAYHANFGIRIVRTDLTVDGGQTAPVITTWGTSSWNGVNSNNVPFSSSRTYTDILPAFNFVINATETQKLRFGAARVVSPQNLMDIGRGNSYGYTRGADGPGGQPRFKFNGGQSGNPNLDPFRATQFNMSWENYVSKGGVISVGFFYKAVDNFVTTAAVPTFVNDDFGGSIANVNTPVNGGSGKIYGGELAGTYNFESGFGVTGNYTIANSDTTQDTSFEKNLPIPGVSHNSLNLTAYYEHAGFSARAAYSWRSSSVNASGVGSTFSYQDINGNPVLATVYAASYGQLDGQVGYDFSKHVGLTFSVLNLTDAKQHTYLQWENQPFTYDDTGRRFFFGVKGAF